MEGLWNFRLAESLGVTVLLDFFRRLKNKNVKSSAEDRGVACDISEGRVDSVKAICYVKILWFCLAGAEKSSVMNK